MSMREQITQAISRVPAASALDGDAVNTIARAVLTELLNPTQYMLVHADDNTAFIAEGRVEWFKTVIEAALIELSEESQG